MQKKEIVIFLQNENILTLTATTTVDTVLKKSGKKSQTQKAKFAWAIFSQMEKCCTLTQTP